MATPQDYGNHAKFVPAFHFFAIPILVFSTFYHGYRLATGPDLDSVVGFASAMAIVVVAFLARLFPLGVQDRVIRLEERLRLQEVLSEGNRQRIGELTTDQLIGLRFASDDEVDALVTRVLAGEFSDRKAIKAAVTRWRADHQRI